jgi:hypothetical protein
VSGISIWKLVALTGWSDARHGDLVARARCAKPVQLASEPRGQPVRHLSAPPADTARRRASRQKFSQYQSFVDWHARC